MEKYISEAQKNQTSRRIALLLLRLPTLGRSSDSKALYNGVGTYFFFFEKKLINLNLLATCSDDTTYTNIQLLHRCNYH